METMELWHGGKLPGIISRIEQPKPGRWEMGPGLYLTTHYSTAQRYAKGGRKVYRVSLVSGKNLGAAAVSQDVLFHFINKTYSKVNAKVLKDYYNDPMNKPRSSVAGMLKLENLLNLTINDELLRPSKAVRLAEFFVECGVDYSVNRHFGGRNETVLVVFNPKIIKKVVPVSAKDWKPDWEPSELDVQTINEFF